MLTIAGGIILAVLALVAIARIGLGSILILVLAIVGLPAFWLIAIVGLPAFWLIAIFGSALATGVFL